MFTFGDRGKVDAVFGEKRLVRGDHGFARGKRDFDRAFRRLTGTADQFDEHIDAGLLRQHGGVVEPFHFLEVDAAILSARTSAHRNDFNGATATHSQRLPLACHLRNQGCTNRA